MSRPDRDAGVAISLQDASVPQSELMLQEQACTKTDLQILKQKLHTSHEELARELNEKLRNINNENMMLRVKQKEDLKHWNDIESKLSMTRAVSDQLTDTYHRIEVQVFEAGRSKALLEGMLAERLRFYVKATQQIDDLSKKFSICDREKALWKCRYGEMKEELKNLEASLASKVAEATRLAAQKEDRERQLVAAKETSDNDKAMLLQIHEKIFAETEKNSDRLAAERGSTERALSDAERLKGQVCELQGTNLSFQNQVQELTQNLSDRDQRLESNEEIVADKLSAIQAELQSARQVTEETSTEILKLNHVIRDLKEKTFKISTELTGMASNLSEAKKQFEAHLQVEEDEVGISLDALAEQIQQDIANLTIKYEAESLKSVAAEVEVAQRIKAEAAIEKHRLEEIIDGLREKTEELLAMAENDMLEAKRQYQLLVDANRAELTDFRKEIALQHEEELKEIRREMEADKIEAASAHVKATQVLTEDRLQEKQRLEEVILRLREENEKNGAQMALLEKRILHIKRQSERDLEAQQATLTKHLKQIAQRNQQEICDMRKRFEVKEMTPEIVVAQDMPEDTLQENPRLEDVSEGCQKQIAQVVTPKIKGHPIEVKQAEPSKDLKKMSREEVQELPTDNLEAEEAAAIQVSQQGSENALVDEERLGVLLNSLQQVHNLEEDDTRFTHIRLEEFNPGPRKGVDGGRIIDIMDIVNEIAQQSRGEGKTAKQQQRPKRKTVEQQEQPEERDCTKKYTSKKTRLKIPEKVLGVSKQLPHITQDLSKRSNSTDIYPGWQQKANHSSRPTLGELFRCTLLDPYDADGDPYTLT